MNVSNFIGRPPNQWLLVVFHALKDTTLCLDWCVRVHSTAIAGAAAIAIAAAWCVVSCESNTLLGRGGELLSFVALRVGGVLVFLGKATLSLHCHLGFCCCSAVAVETQEGSQSVVQAYSK